MKTWRGQICGSAAINNQLELAGGSMHFILNLLSEKERDKKCSIALKLKTLYLQTLSL